MELTYQERADLDKIISESEKVISGDKKNGSELSDEEIEAGMKVIVKVCREYLNREYVEKT